ncbi:MAG: hypothetical protein ABIM89_00290 [Mycobacteriales bacterium]
MVLALVGAIGGRLAWRLVDDNVLHPERARSAAQFERFNNRIGPPAGDAAAYAELGRRLVAPDLPLRPAMDFEAGPVTPTAMARMSDGAITTSELTAGGMLHGWVAGWDSSTKKRHVFTVLHEFRDGRDLRPLVQEQLKVVAASTRKPTVTVKMPAGISAIATTEKDSGGYALVAVCYAGSRMATITLITQNRPGSEEITWMTSLAQKQQAALA